MPYLIGIDPGGTFTDAFVADQQNRLAATKTPSTPLNFAEGFLNAVDGLAGELNVDVAELLDGTEYIVHGTTSKLNALLTGDVAQVGFLTTRGHVRSISIMNLEAMPGSAVPRSNIWRAWQSRPHCCPGTEFARSFSRSSLVMQGSGGRVAATAHSHAITTIASVATGSIAGCARVATELLPTRWSLPTWAVPPFGWLVVEGKPVATTGRILARRARRVRPRQHAFRRPTYIDVSRQTVTHQRRDAMLAAQALHSAPRPYDVIGTAAFLLSDDAA